MKKTLLMAFLAVAMTANAEEINENDVLNEGDMAVLAINDSEETNFQREKKDEKKDEDDPWDMHVNIGINIPTNTPSGVDFAPFRSWDIGWTVVQYDYTPKKSKTTLSAGLGFSFRDYTLKGHDKMFNKVDKNISVNDRIENMKKLSSSIYTMGFSMPLLVKQRFGKNFAISLGAQLNWYCYARLHNDYEIGDDEYQVGTKDIGHRPITVDVLGIIHFAKHFGIYCKYSPMSVMKKDRGPEFKSISVGLYF